MTDYPNIKFVTNYPDGDWMGLYIDRKLVYEGHSMDEQMMLEFLKIPYDVFPLNMEDEGISNFPENFDNLKREE